MAPKYLNDLLQIMANIFYSQHSLGTPDFLLLASRTTHQDG